MRPLAATCGHLLWRPLAATCGHLLWRPLAATRLAAGGCKWLPMKRECGRPLAATRVAASGCKWLPMKKQMLVATGGHSIGCKWLPLRRECWRTLAATRLAPSFNKSFLLISTPSFLFELVHFRCGSFPVVPSLLFFVAALSASFSKSFPLNFYSFIFV